MLKTLYGNIPLRNGNGDVCGFNLSDLTWKNVPFLRRNLGIVFQDFQLLTDRNVNDNLLFGSYNYTISNLDFNISDSLKPTSILINYHKISELTTNFNSSHNGSMHCFGTYTELPISEALRIKI